MSTLLVRLRQWVNTERILFGSTVSAHLVAEAADALERQASSTEAMMGALAQISLCSQNSASSKEECGRIARAALAQPDGDWYTQLRERGAASIAQRADEPVAWVTECDEIGYDGKPTRLRDLDWYESEIEHLPVGTKLYPHAAPAAPATQRADEPVACIGNDPLCPCQDGDACHYKDTPTTKGWPVPAQREDEPNNLIARLRRAPTPDNDPNLPDEAADELERQSNNALILAQQVADLTAELELRRKSGSATDRLHNLCEGIAKDADGSEWSREEWERLDADMLAMKKVNADLTRERDAAETRSATMSGHIRRIEAELQREHEDHKQTNEDAAMYMRDAERWRMFLSTRPPETHEAICSAIDGARGKP